MSDEKSAPNASKARVPGETMLHELKTWPAPFEAIEAGTKHHEIRKNDRLFVQGDLLQLREWDPSTEKYTGRERTVRVSYASYGGAWGLPEDICVLSIERATPSSCKAEADAYREGWNAALETAASLAAIEQKYWSTRGADGQFASENLKSLILRMALPFTRSDQEKKA